MKLHALVLEHRHGTDVSLHRTPEDASAHLADYVAEWWCEEIDDVPHDTDAPRVPRWDLTPRIDRAPVTAEGVPVTGNGFLVTDELVTEYFERVETEGYVIAETSLPPENAGDRTEEVVDLIDS